MTSRYTPLFDAIALLEANHKSPDLLPAIKNFPFSQMYTGQKKILEQIPDGESAVICSHTGMGKTAIFLSITRDAPSIVIEPRKFLQTQVAKYFNDTVLFGRSGYPCEYAHSAASAPCLLKEKCSDTQFHRTCENATQTCLNKECDIFPVEGSYEIYPCEGCEYLAAQKEAIRVVGSGKTCVCNFGNFWMLLKLAKTVVVDEADLFFREISAPVAIRYTKPKDLKDL